MASTTKTLVELEAAIKETFRKWKLEEPTLEYGLARRSLSQKKYQTPDERAVKISFAYIDSSWRTKRIRVVMGV